MYNSMKKSSNKKSILAGDGFTIIELLVFIVVIGAVGLFAVVNIRSMRSENRDSAKKTTVNTLTYQLESSYEKKGFYPEDITEKTVPGADLDALSDTNGLKLNQPGSSFQYKPSGCKEKECSGFTLTAQLEKEAPYVKESLR